MNGAIGYLDSIDRYTSCVIVDRRNVDCIKVMLGQGADTWLEESKLCEKVSGGESRE